LKVELVLATELSMRVLRLLETAAWEVESYEEEEGTSREMGSETVGKRNSVTHSG
jgi:hypothetical protein